MRDGLCHKFTGNLSHERMKWNAHASPVTICKFFVSWLQVWVGWSPVLTRSFVQTITNARNCMLRAMVLLQLQIEISFSRQICIWNCAIKKCTQWLYRTKCICRSQRCLSLSLFLSSFQRRPVSFHGLLFVSSAGLSVRPCVSIWILLGASEIERQAITQQNRQSQSP